MVSGDDVLCSFQLFLLVATCSHIWALVTKPYHCKPDYLVMFQPNPYQNQIVPLVGFTCTYVCVCVGVSVRARAFANEKAKNLPFTMFDFN